MDNFIEEGQRLLVSVAQDGIAEAARLSSELEALQAKRFAESQLVAEYDWEIRHLTQQLNEQKEHTAEVSRQRDAKDKRVRYLRLDSHAMSSALNNDLACLEDEYFGDVEEAFSLERAREAYIEENKDIVERLQAQLEAIEFDMALNNERLGTELRGIQCAHEELVEESSAEIKLLQEEKEKDNGFLGDEVGRIEKLHAEALAKEKTIDREAKRHARQLLYSESLKRGVTKAAGAAAERSIESAASISWRSAYEVTRLHIRHEQQSMNAAKPSAAESTASRGGKQKKSLARQPSVQLARARSGIPATPRLRDVTEIDMELPSSPELGPW